MNHEIDLIVNFSAKLNKAPDLLELRVTMRPRIEVATMVQGLDSSVKYRAEKVAQGSEALRRGGGEAAHASVPTDGLGTARRVPRGRGARPGPDQVLVRMAGAGLCRTDLHILASEPGFWPDPPFTLGHENAGWVAASGTAVRGLADGDGVLISSMYYCGHCDRCDRGRHESCRAVGLPGYGVGYDGGLADYILVEARHAVPLGDLNPVLAAPLADAAATSYHAVGLVRTDLVPGTTAVVIGVGGLGGYAVQYLRLLTGTRVIAVDTAPARLAEARRLGAHDTVISDGQTDDVIAELTGGRGADAVLDLVGTTATLTTAVAAVAGGGRVVVAGIGGGAIPMGWERIAMNAGLLSTRGFNRGDLNEIIGLARSGDIEIPATRFPFEEIPAALEALDSAQVNGRAVIELT
jgi:propanol-preferring alcohol dehydrogenase